MAMPTLQQIIGTITGKVAFERTQANFTTIKDAHNGLETKVDKHKDDDAAHEDIREQVNTLDTTVGEHISNISSSTNAGHTKLGPLADSAVVTINSGSDEQVNVSLDLGEISDTRYGIPFQLYLISASVREFAMVVNTGLWLVSILDQFTGTVTPILDQSDISIDISSGNIILSSASSNPRQLIASKIQLV